MISITDKAKEKGSFVFDVAFTDEDDAAATPKTMTWSLTTTSGTSINNRLNVAVGAGDLAATVSIVLSGDDLAVQSGETNRYLRRRFVVEATYDSSLGNDLPVKEEAEFLLENITKVT